MITLQHRGIAVATGCGVLTLVSCLSCIFLVLCLALTRERRLQASIYLVTNPVNAWLIGVFYGVLDSFSFIGVGVAMSDSFGRAHLAELMSITRCAATYPVNASLCHHHWRHNSCVVGARRSVWGLGPSCLVHQKTFLRGAVAAAALWEAEALIFAHLFCAATRQFLYLMAWACCF